MPSREASIEASLALRKYWSFSHMCLPAMQIQRAPKYDVHLREETLRDVGKLDMIVEERGKWDDEESIEGLWLVLDSIELWAHENWFHVKEESLMSARLECASSPMEYDACVV